MIVQESVKLQFNMLYKFLTFILRSFFILAMHIGE